ncbi:lipocalin family protein [Bacteroidota bacterium]
MTLIFNCTQDDSNSVDNQDNPIIGTWNLVKAVKISDNSEVVFQSVIQILTFNADGSFRVDMMGLYNSGTWNVSASSLNITYTHVEIEGVTENQPYTYPYIIDGNELIITTAWDFEGQEAPAYLHYSRN